MRATGGAPESQSRVYRRNGLSPRWIRRWCAGVWVGASVRRWVGVVGDGVGKMGVGGDLLPRTSGLGVLLKNLQVYAKTHRFG